MLKRSHFAPIFSGALLCFLLILLAACSSLPGGSGGQSIPTPGMGGSKTSTPSSGNNNPGQTMPMPQTRTDCPATNTARAAVMRPLALGSHQNLVYIYNEVPQNTSTAYGRLRRYDAMNGQKTDIITSGIQILQAQVSSDGQWVLFLSMPDPRGGLHVVMLQLVRMDGQGLQTLVCLPYSGSGGEPLGKPTISFQWSVDEKSILLSYDAVDNPPNKATSTITVLNVSTGTLKPIFMDQGDDLYTYSLVTWLDNTHAYIIKEGISGPTPPATVFLINTATATVAQPGLVNILTTMTRFSNYSLDSSYDGTQLYSSYCLQAASPFNTNIQVGPAMGGARHTIFQEQPADCVQVLRAVKPQTLLLLVVVSNATTSSTQIWTMSLPDGSMRVLTPLTSSLPGASNQSYDLNETSQFPWSSVSRDGSMYALQEVDSSTQTQSIVIASLNGGKPTTIATTNPGSSLVSLAGWTTM
ncbi:MAG TPA: hypothetical protein VKR83_13010 [Ktedonobacteraceae bacterium]|nr:hypothetical protein [Ktedonobacteraceae bacterium]